MNNKKVLVVVDMQNDFCRPDGALFVPGAVEAVRNVAKLISDKVVSKVVFTADYHPENHCSFGMWPVHCVAGTEGADIVDELIIACQKSRTPYNLVLKGQEQDKEEYGAFAVKEANKEPLKILEGFDEVIVCGVAGDFCVMESIKNMKPLWSKMKLYSDGVASIKGDHIIEDFIKETKLIQKI